jgi:hypothetical protein
MVILNPIVKNFLDEPLMYKVQKQDGSYMEGELKPNSFAEILGLSVGDEIKLWNDEHVAQQEFVSPKNNKYIVTYPHRKRDTVFRNSGYRPIVVSRWSERRSPIIIEKHIRESEPKELPQPKSENKQFIFTMVLIVLLGVGLMFAIFYIMVTRRTFGGSQSGGQDMLIQPIQQIESIII